MPKKPAKRFPLVPVAVVAGIAIIAVVAIVATTLGDDGGDGSVATGSNSSTTLRQTGEVSVSGTPLAEFASGVTDPTVGTAAPVIKGTSFDGTPIAIEPGAPTLVLFAAHWCPHCQAEIPRLAGPFRNLPGGTKVVTVSTGAVSNRPNYPPSAWFENEKWPTPVLADDDKSTAAMAYGLSSFPYFVFLDKSGKVVERFVGERSADQVMDRLRALAAAG